jgi:hypothetical protein
MKKLLTLLCFAPSLALAGTVFDGTWKTKLDSVKQSGPPDAYEISQGIYRCTSCVPKIEVKADGMDQTVAGHDYYDSIAIKIVDDHAIETTRKKGGKIAGTDKATVSSDGKTLSEEWVDYSGATAAKGSGTSKRLSAGPSGSHAISGTWQAEQLHSSRSSSSPPTTA